MEIKHKSYSGERSLYSLKNASLFDVTFLDGESPLKECSSLSLDNCRKSLPTCRRKASSVRRNE